ncbi:MAG: DUF234 domain-containing protein [Campylobacterota bacterium]|nr:DUF234 domain-containing protein [Campylobacterota bacterium]
MSKGKRNSPGGLSSAQEKKHLSGNILLRQFRSFYARHFPNDMEQHIEYFAIFGGLGWDIDIDAPLDKLITGHILDNYGHLYNAISARTLGEPMHHRLLSALAIGDRRIHSAFKRAHISEAAGGEALDYLRHAGLLEMEYSREKLPEKLYPKQQLKKEIRRHRISHKMHFTSPFLRFWFYFIAPFHKQIEKGEYEPVLERFHERQQSFTGRIFEELSDLLLTTHRSDDPIIDSGSYWDRQVEIDILAQTQQGRTIVGECKWTNHKINRSELGKLQEKCERVGITPDQIVMFSKRGYSNELKRSDNPSLLLYDASDFSQLLQNIGANDILKGYDRPY